VQQYEYEIVIMQPQSLVTGSSIAAAIVGMLFIAYTYISCAAMEVSSVDTAVFTMDAWAFDVFVALCGFAGCVCAALAVPTLFVWLLLLLSMFLNVYRVFLARLAVDTAAGNEEGPIMRVEWCTRRPFHFWVVGMYSLFQISVDTGIFLAYTNTWYSSAFWLGLGMVCLAYGLWLVTLINASRPLTILAIGCIAMALLVLAVTADTWLEFSLLLVASLLVFGLFIFQCWNAYTSLLEGLRARRETARAAEAAQPVAAAQDLAKTPYVQLGDASAAAEGAPDVQLPRMRKWRKSKT
jgi:hypothetical protein